MKNVIFALSLALCIAGCAHTSSDKQSAHWNTEKQWSQWSKLMIQSDKHGSFSPAYFVETAKRYLQANHIVVDDLEPVVDIEVCTLERMGFVKFRQGAESVCAVEIGPDATAVRHHQIRLLQ